MVDLANGCGSGKPVTGSSEYGSRCGLESGEETTALNTGDERDGSGVGNDIVVGSHDQNAQS